jgi:alkane 1-monooxygenase
MKAFEFGMIYLIPLSVIAGLILGNLFIFLTPVFVFGLIPLLDAIIGRDTVNPPDERAPALSRNPLYRLLTWGCVPLQVGLVIWGGAVASNWSLSVEEFLGFTLSMGICSAAMGITVAHELAHRESGSLEHLLSKILLSTVLYVHWGVDHVIGHHQQMATPDDPSTARLGESVYHFLPRSVSGGFNRAWTIEAVRQENKGRPVWNSRNPMVRGLSGQVALLVGFALIFGPAGFFFFVCQALVAIALLEIVDYIGHYGLVREIAADGHFVPPATHHTWNAGNRLTNRFLFNLQRHSDHHAHPGRHYQLLRLHEQSPQLPTGYAGMVLMALIPPLWRSIMDKRIGDASALKIVHRPDN